MQDFFHPYIYMYYIYIYISTLHSSRSASKPRLRGTFARVCSPSARDLGRSVVGSISIAFESRCLFLSNGWGFRNEDFHGDVRFGCETGMLSSNDKVCDIENGPVEIVDLSIIYIYIKMVDLSIVT